MDKRLLIIGSIMAVFLIGLAVAQSYNFNLPNLGQGKKIFNQHCEFELPIEISYDVMNNTIIGNQRYLEVKAKIWFSDRQCVKGWHKEFSVPSSWSVNDIKLELKDRLNQYLYNHAINSTTYTPITPLTGQGGTFIVTG